MNAPKQLLVAIDDFQSSISLLEYVGELAGGRDDFRIHLVHALRPVPPRLLESRGAEDPAEERRIETELGRKEESWIKTAENEAKPMLQSARAKLTAAHVPGENIHTHLITLIYQKDLAQELIKTAQENHCGTIVVGRSSYPWFPKLFQAHLSDQLLTGSDELAVWVVNGNDAAQ
ncbi:MAG TPA: universal stress protein [Terriglobales bacterium]|nr:universal stress protein [Terriglobales bacterium]